MKLSFLLFLGCLAMTCLAFPTRDYTPVTDPDKDDKSTDDDRIPERQQPEEFRRRRYAQMNPGQGQPAESTTLQPESTTEQSGDKMLEGTRPRRYDHGKMGQDKSDENQESQEHDSTTQQPSEPTTDQPLAEMPESGKQMPMGSRQRRNGQINPDQVEPTESTSEQPSTESQTTESTTGKPFIDHPVPEEMKPIDNRQQRSAEKDVAQELRQQPELTTQQPLESTSEQSSTEKPTPIVKLAEPRRRRNAQIAAVPGLDKSTQSQLSESATVQPSTEENSPRSTSEHPLTDCESSESAPPKPTPKPKPKPSVDEESAAGGMKPVDARRRRNTQMELALVGNRQPRPTEQLLPEDQTATEEPYSEDRDSAEKTSEGTRQRRHGHGQRGEDISQEHELTTKQPSTNQPDSSDQQKPEGTRRRRQLEQGSGNLPESIAEQSLTKDETSGTTTKIASTETPKEQTLVGAEIIRHRRQMSMGEEMSQQPEMTTAQSTNGNETPTSTSEQSSTEQPVPEKKAQESRRRRNVQIDLAPGISLQPEQTTQQSTTEMPSTAAPEKMVPDTRRRRHTPMGQGASEQAEMTEQPSTQRPDSQESQEKLPGARQKRNVQGEPRLGVQLGDTTVQPPAGEPEGTGSMYTTKQPETEDREDKTEDQSEESTNEEEEKTTGMPEEKTSDNFWQRKARLWEHLW